MTWTNWAANQRTAPARTVTAKDTDDVVATVKAAARDGLRVKATGSGHSFTGIGVPDGIALATPSSPELLAVAGDRVTVPAGMTIRTLNALLAEHGRALPNLGDIDAQTIAGAVATGTHGTGARHQGIAAGIRGLEMVLADGSVVTATATEHPELFRHGRVGLGALGVVTAVELETVPAFALHARESARPLGEVLESFDELAAAHDHVEFYWFPHTDVAATKINDRVSDEAPGPARGRVAEWVGDELLGNGGFAAVCRLGAAVPRAVPALNRVMAARMANAEYVDRSYRVFTSPRRVRFLEMEYAVPRDALPEAFAGLRAAAARHAADVTFPVEVRVAGADDVPLSTASGRDSAYLAVHVYRGRPHEAYFAAVESVMTALGGRPHWGKLHTRTAAQLAASYPEFGAFVALRDRLDPAGLFHNAHLERILGAPPR
ncbi:D-arabinono-1,4-lactone oxidase [Actinomycetospora sp. TBRC 11914]|uniref:D-arabinono-1,4-lactone oxidase n=1 Tax=Actinomycetospora sp. TBRC 11914 TaxID=2729387 RepID=UPI00145DE72A|nr:D-arabinono-1,4-lactone oxidase [Actinomycetospora sp. TBRC 11914]NMO89843.1 FAD-binding protein [Actinomycetospora sp. TBRC 11914]